MTSKSITPARRSRDESIDSDDPNGASRAVTSGRRSSKRTRLGSEDDDDDVVEDDTSEGSEPPLLPESFRRSPKGKHSVVQKATSDRATSARTTSARATSARATSIRASSIRAMSVSTAQDFLPGSIVRVALKDFVTYTEAEFHPGPNLNMVIGPNGTGKSTLVCAICLGLGWSTSHLGRAKDIGEFVKHGAETASIEIELAKNPARQQGNPLIECEISKEGNKTRFSIDGRRSNKKEVQELAQSFSIQVDNLCQFLPQDRVVEFAALSPVELLAQTQRAAAPEEMTQWHEELKTMSKEEKALQSQQQTLNEELKNLEDRQRSQAGDVERLRERAKLSEMAAVFQKLMPCTEYCKIRRQAAEARSEWDDAKEELRRLKDQLDPNLEAIAQKEQHCSQIEKTSSQQRRVVERAEKHAGAQMTRYTEVTAKIKQSMDDMNIESNNSKKAKQAMTRLQQEGEKLQEAIDGPAPSFDSSEINEILRQKRSQVREIDTEIEDHKSKNRDVLTLGRKKKDLLQKIEDQIQKLQSQAGRQANKLESVSRDAAAAWKWIQDNQAQFSGRVYGPPMIECSVKDVSHANFVETILPESELVAFTVSSKEDFKVLQDQLYTKMKLSDINIRSVTQQLSQFPPPLPQDQLQTLGLDCWILDLIEGPEAVLAMLCDNARINQTAFTGTEPNNQQHAAIEKSGLSAWITPTVFNQLTRRREYGGAASTRIRPVKKARLLTDAPVDVQIEQELQAQLSEVRDEISKMQDSVRATKGQIDDLERDRARIEKESDQITKEKSQKQRQLAEFNALPTKLEGVKRKLEELKQQSAGSQARALKIHDTLDKLHLEKGQLAIDYARGIETLRTLHIKLFETELAQIESSSDLEQLHARQSEELASLQRLEEKVLELRVVVKKFHTDGKKLQGQLVALNETLSEQEREVQEQIQDWEPDQLNTEIQSVHAQLEMLHGGNEDLIQQYEQRGRKIEEKNRRLQELQASLENVSNNIAQVRERWEPRLDDLVQQISAAFADNFSRIHCVGEVAMHKDDDFDQWAIQIKVKFREQEQLSILDSHRQSGGERAVSTIFYLMALQSLARAPFRVVDEINQGMDPRNERLVHSRMVDIACAEQTCQYFLITPKLLSGLKYHPKMKVHCIASGEYMPDDHRQLDFGVLAKRALAVRAAVAAS